MPEISQLYLFNNANSALTLKSLACPNLLWGRATIDNRTNIVETTIIIIMIAAIGTKHGINENGAEKYDAITVDTVTPCFCFNIYVGHIQNSRLADRTVSTRRSVSEHAADKN